MAIIEREPRTTELEQLEELWRAPAAEKPAPARRRRIPLPRVGPVLAYYWAAFLVLIAFEPVPPEDVPVPLWGTMVVLAFLTSLIAAGAFALMRRLPLAFGASALAGGLGIVVAIGCKTTAHHAGSWWLIETVAMAGALALSVAGWRRSR
jgi:hypothetical protein